jgi:hypothetical protein
MKEKIDNLLYKIFNEENIKESRFDTMIVDSETYTELKPYISIIKEPYYEDMIDMAFYLGKYHIMETLVPKHKVSILINCEIGPQKEFTLIDEQREYYID